MCLYVHQPSYTAVPLVLFSPFLALREHFAPVHLLLFILKDISNNIVLLTDLYDYAKLRALVCVCADKYECVQTRAMTFSQKELFLA